MKTEMYRSTGGIHGFLYVKTQRKANVKAAGRENDNAEKRTGASSYEGGGGVHRAPGSIAADKNGAL